MNPSLFLLFYYIGWVVGQSKFEIQGVPGKIDYTPFTEQYINPGALQELLILRFQWPDVAFSPEDRAFSFTQWYTYNQKPNKLLGTYLAYNSLDRFGFGVPRTGGVVTGVDLEPIIYTSSYNYSELIKNLGVLTSGNMQAYYNAIGNEAIRLYANESGQTVAVYRTFVVHYPEGAAGDLGVIGKGLVIRGASQQYTRWRTLTQKWGKYFGINTGGLLRPSVLTSRWSAIPQADFINGMSPDGKTTMDFDGHYPAHEKVRMGWYYKNQEYRVVNTSGTYRIYAHNIEPFKTNRTMVISIGDYNYTWWFSYTYMSEILRTGATAYITTGDIDIPYLLVDATPQTDSCPNCPLGWNCPICTTASMKDVTIDTNVYSTPNFQAFITGSGQDNSDKANWIDLQIIFFPASQNQLCPFRDFYGPGCNTTCYGATTQCGGASQGICATGPQANTGCRCLGNWTGPGCTKDDPCDVDMLAAPDRSSYLYSYDDNFGSVFETYSDFKVVGRQMQIDKITISGKFEGTAPYLMPGGVKVAVYNDSKPGGQVGNLIRRQTLIHGIDNVNITVQTPDLYSAINITIRLPRSHPLYATILDPGKYWISIMPMLTSGQKWKHETILTGQGYPDFQQERKNGINGPMVSAKSDARVAIYSDSERCVEWFKPFPNMSVLVIRMEFPDMRMEDATRNYNYVQLFGGGGVISEKIKTSSQGMASFFTEGFASQFYITPVYMSNLSFSAIASTADLNITFKRPYIFETMKAEALRQVRAANVIDPDYYDFWIGVYPTFGNNKILQRPYPTTKAVWTVGIPTVNYNSFLNAFGYVLTLDQAYFLRKAIAGSVFDDVRVPSGDTINTMGWSWLQEPFGSNNSRLTDYNVMDKTYLNWITEKAGEVITLTWKDPGRYRIYAYNLIPSGKLVGIRMTEPGVRHAWWVQYFYSGFLKPGAQIFLQNEDLSTTFFDSSPQINKCPGCITGLEPECRSCDLRDSLVEPGSYLQVGYVRIDVLAMGTDSTGPYLDLNIDFIGPDEKCPLLGHYGSKCNFQCPGGPMNTCSGHGTCSTGITGTGICTCVTGWTGMDCSRNDDCDLIKQSIPIPAITRDDVLVPSYISADRTIEAGFASDFVVDRPAQIESIVVYGVSQDCCPGAPEVYRATVPREVTVRIYYDYAGKPGSIWYETTVQSPMWVKMDKGTFLNDVTRLTITFPMDYDITRRTLYTGRYWLQVLATGSSEWNILVSTAARGASDLPDMYRDRYNNLFQKGWSDWVPSTNLSSLYGNAPSLEVVYAINYYRCLPVYKHSGVPLPRPDITTDVWMDFWPKRVNMFETVTFQFTGYIPYSQRGIKIKIADPNAGYGCLGEAPGGEAQVLNPVDWPISYEYMKLTFKISAPGTYSFCIQPNNDIDWEEVGTEKLVVDDFLPLADWYGYSTCANLVSHNSTACGCMYDQNTPTFTGQKNTITLPMTMPFDLIMSGTQSVTVRQGCCTYTTAAVETRQVLKSTQATWSVCSN